ncbi:MAG: hypothetical protein AAGH65_04560 [Pseudomonadota bacterium]
MKKTLIIIGSIVAVLFVLNSLVTSWFVGMADEHVLTMDPLEPLNEACSTRACLAAVERYGPACVSRSGPTVDGLDTFLEHVANVMICVNDRSGVEHFPTED